MVKKILKTKQILHQLAEGRRIYNRLKNGYHNHIIYISQHPAIGDAYLMGSYLKIFMRDQDILTFVGHAAEQIYKLYGFNNLYELTQSETNSLIRYVQFMEITSDKVVILHYQALAEHTGIAFQFNGVHGLCFSDLLEKTIFRNYQQADRIYPYLKKNKDFENVRKNKSVIFFPYANTLDIPPRQFWRRWIDQYIKLGKSVYTYIWEKEEPLENTIAITCELEDLYSLVEYAGEIIGVRNGIMDLISQAECVKTIFYPSQGAESWIKGSIKDFWSLKKFGYGSSYNEVEW